MMATSTADVFSVAKHVRQRLGQVDPRKLQKLVYYVLAVYYAECWRDAEADRETIDRPTFTGSSDELDAALAR